jgi:hypothetical protein
MITCPTCETENLDGTLFCDNCGAELPESTFAQTAADGMYEIPINSAGPFLLHKKSGEKFQLSHREEILIGREDPVSGIFPDIDTTTVGGEEDGVSRQHARITSLGDQYFVEDLDSVNATFVNQVKLSPHAPVSLNDGDELILGRLKLVLKMN